METKILTQEERAELKKELEDFLDVYSAEVEISEKPEILHHSFKQDDSPKKEWHENLYQITIKSSIGDYDNGHSIHPSWSIKEFARHIAHEFFMMNDGGVNSPLANKLWADNN